MRTAILTITLMLSFLTAGCAGAAPEVGQSAEETLGEAPAESEPIVEHTAAAPTEVASAEAEMPGDEPPEPEPDEPPSELVTDPEVEARFPERRLLTLETPRRIRMGDSEIVRIVLEIDEEGKITPTAFFDENEVQTQAVEILNLYDTHTIRAEARLEMAGVEVVPPGSIERRLNPGETVEFTWSVIPEGTGSYRGNVWVFLRYIPKGGGEILERSLFSQLIEFESVNLLGMGGSSARWLGAAGTLITSLFGLDDVIKWLRRGRKGRAKVA